MRQEKKLFGKEKVNKEILFRLRYETIQPPILCHHFISNHLKICYILKTKMYKITPNEQEKDQGN